MKFKYIGLLVVLVGVAISSCKEKETQFDNPYDGGLPPLGITVNRAQIPVPAAGQAGTEVKIAATGLMPYEGKLKFLFNGEEATNVKVTPEGVTATVPGRASSGVTAFVVDGQLVFGPDFRVFGLVNRDFTYKVVNGASAAVWKAVLLPTGNTLLLGSFQNFDNKGIVKPINRIVRTLPDGTIDRSFQSGFGANGLLNSFAIVGSSHFIGGGFSGYAQRDGLNNIAKIAASGVIDTMEVRTYTEKTKFVATFNGGVDAQVRYLHPSGGNKVIAVGDFKYYLSRRYDQPTSLYKDSVVVDSVDVRQLARFNMDGSLDRTWRFDPEAIGYGGLKGKSLPGGTGRISTLMHTDEKLLGWGQFTKFDDVPVGYIVRLNANGTIDNTFNVGGAGADNYIDFVSYNATTNKYLVVGRFKTFNGVSSPNMVLLNYDGSVDQSFKPKAFNGGTPYFAKQLDDGLTLVSGDFKTYDGVNRQGFLFVNKTGDLAPGYNTIGNLLGSVYRINDAMETQSADGKRALLIVGDFYVFDNVPTYNIVRVTLEL